MPQSIPPQVEELDLTPPDNYEDLQLWLKRNFAILVAEDWHEIGASGEPAFENSWANRGSGDDPTTAFYKDPFGIVRFKGVLDTSGASTGTIIFTLPEEYRPTNDFIFTAGQTGITGDVGSIEVNTDGELTGNFQIAATALHLNNVDYRV